MSRISIVGLILCACFVSVAWGQQPTCKASTPWVEFHRRNMARWNPCEQVLNVNNVGSLQLKWTSSLYMGVPSSPAVANGVVYVGSDDHKLYALKASTGKKLWSYRTGKYIRSSPAVAHGVVYVISHDAKVYALNAKSGTLLWSYATGGGAVESSPAVANGVVYVSSEDHNVYALNASTGDKLWSYTTGSGVVSSPAVANGVVYVGSYDGNVYAFGLKEGLE